MDVEMAGDGVKTEAFIDTSEEIIRSDEESAVATDDPSSPLPTSSEDDHVSTADDEGRDWMLGQEELVQDQSPDILEIIKGLRDTMEFSQRDFVFVCGGSIPITTPVALRWDRRNDEKAASCCKLIIDGEGDGIKHGDINNLIADMRPATFGLAGEDVYDERYRKALQLEPSNFSSSFCPYTSGIVDSIRQILAPGLGNGASSARAELYKLNVYQGPSGHFRAHVDTPRSPSHFGSLVVCLPVRHAGGNLQVRHNDKSMSFDWSTNSSANQPSIQWAAFYSDCEHEVLPVTSGHRLTLTYNLYSVAPDPDLSKPTDLELPLIQQMELVLNNPDFLPKGGYLGFYTTHAYPHSSDSFSISASLKGIDKVIWQGFQRLGCGVCMRPVLDVARQFGRQGNSEDARPRPVLGKYLKLTTVDGTFEDWNGMESVMFDDCYNSNLVEEGIGFEKVFWINRPTEEKHREAQLAYTAYGNEGSSAFIYSWCAIIIGVPPYSGEHGGRMRLEKTFEERTRDWDDPLCTVSFLPK